MSKYHVFTISTTGWEPWKLNDISGCYGSKYEDDSVELYSLIQDAHFTLMMQAVTMSEMLVNFWRDYMAPHPRRHPLPWKILGEYFVYILMLQIIIVSLLMQAELLGKFWLYFEASWVKNCCIFPTSYILLLHGITILHQFFLPKKHLIQHVFNSDNQFITV